MKPTMKLRHVQRGWKNTVSAWDPQLGRYGREPFYVLQQWWTKDDTMPGFEDLVGEWRDIPIEVEK